MSALSKWNPLKEFEKEFEEFGRRMAPWFGRMTREESQPLTVTEWMPTVDIAEDDHAYLVTAELPEIKKEEVKVAIADGALVISGERKKETEKKGLRYHRIERSYGSFLRSFTLPADADPKKVKAEMKDGVLHVRIGKRDGAVPTSTPITIE